MGSFLFLKGCEEITHISTRRVAVPLGRCGFGLFRHLSSTTQPTHLVLTEAMDAGVHVLTLNNEKRANCLSLAMIRELHAAIKRVKEMPEVRVVVIRGSGRFFSAGHDLKELMQDKGSGKWAEVFSACSNMMVDLAKLRVPSIAAVSGPAHAAGCQLVATCDMAVAGTSATFATPGIKIGLFCSTPAVALIRAIGMRPAKELLFTGRAISATRAYELGLVNRVVPDEQVLDSALELAREVAQHSRPVLIMGKQALNAQASLDIEESYDLATQVMLENLELSDAQKGIQAFLNKEPMPQWTHKKD
ncbi:putative enoyl-CoA hydratase [Opisthorchis viverrini]|uniref:Enoyl-CoA hydratase domain-containing protein 3, mitochondrial n=1 Tax=Opisthorchis viverrini TaxID=6198 RepID=A0A1S8XB01_OPIVI|nr:putative enoyl-CoA hydratase [Opisthorchis viverrini]